MSKGAYILKREERKPNFTLIATGSEVSLAMDVAVALEKLGKAVRVISLPCWELFEQQSEEYIKSVVGGDIGKRVSIEAGVTYGWSKWIGTEGLAIGMDTYGESAPQSDLAAEFGFTVDSILNRLLT
jgi:transketolase